MNNSKTTKTFQLNKKTAFKFCLDFWSNLFFVCCVIIAFALILFSTVAIECDVIGESMQPLLNNEKHAEADCVYVNKYDKHLNYEDIVVVKTDKENIIKRVVGLSGDRINIVLEPESNVYKLSRNGLIIDEDYIKLAVGNDKPADIRNGMKHTLNQFETLREKIPEQFNEDGELIIGDNEIFVLGDNRAVSLDSSHYGPFNLSCLIGKVEWIRYHNQSSFDFYYNYIINGKFFVTIENLL